MRVYPLSEYKLKELRLAELKEKHYKSPYDAFYQNNRAYFINHIPSGVQMEDFVSQQWEQLNYGLQHLYMRMYRNSKEELYQAAEQLLIEPKRPPNGPFLFAQNMLYRDPQNKTPILILYNQLSQKERDEYDYQYRKLMEQFEQDHQKWKLRYQTFFSNDSTTADQVMKSYKQQKLEYELKLKEEENKLMQMTNKQLIMKKNQDQMNKQQESEKKLIRKQQEFISNFLGLSTHLAQFIDQ